jgi:hypothetical protein
VPSFILSGDPTSAFVHSYWVAGQDSNLWLLDALIADPAPLGVPKHFDF